MQPFSHAINEPGRLSRMVGVSIAVHLAMIGGLVIVEMLAPPAIDFRDAIQVVLVPPSAPLSEPTPSPDKPPPPAPPIPKAPPPPPPAQARRDPVLAPLDDNPLWDKLSDEPPPEESDLARQFREMERAKTAPPVESEEYEKWWREMMASAPKPLPQAPEPEAETPPVADTPSLSEAFEQLRAAEKQPEDTPLISGELTQWLDAQIGLVLSPGANSQERIPDVDRYTAAVKARVDSRWSPPDLFRGSGAKALLTFVIERDGRVSEVRLARSSGSNHYDDTAMRAVLTSSPFPPLPETWKAPAMQVNYVFEFAPGRRP
ncbi:MAG: TonB family protein [Nitrospirota bacterium]|nr:TonB family protein [Nitrospirota bacterium]